MVPSLSPRTQQQHRPDPNSTSSSSSSTSSSSHPRVLKKRFTLQKSTDSSISASSSSDGGTSTGGGGGVLMKRNSNKSQMATGDLNNEELQNPTNHGSNHHHHNANGGIWKSLSSSLQQQHHPWALRFKEEGLPHYLHGKSLQGNAVLYIKLHKNRLPDLIKNGCTMDQIEAYFHLMLDFLSRPCRGDDDGGGFVVVVDMKHSKMKHLTGEETCQALKKLEKLCRSPQYPPQMIQRIVMTHAPLWLTSAWPGLKVLVPDGIPIHVVNSTKTHKKLLKYISQDELPEEFGGKEDSHLGEHISDKELQELLTKLGGGDMMTTTTTVAAATPSPPPPIEAANASSELSTGGVVASARNLLTVSLRFHREEEGKQETQQEVQEGVETVVKSQKNKPRKKFMFPKLCPRRKCSAAGSNSSKTSSEKSSFSTLDDGGQRRQISMDDSEEESSGVVEHNEEVVETAGLISSSYNNNNNQDDTSIWLPFFKWLSTEKTSCPPHKTTVYYSSTVENIVPVPLVGVVPPRPQNKSSSRRQQQGLLPKRRRLPQGDLQRKSAFGRGKRNARRPSQ